MTTSDVCPSFLIRKDNDIDLGGFSGKGWVCCARGWPATWRRSRRCSSYWASVRRRWSGGRNVNTTVELWPTAFLSKEQFLLNEIDSFSKVQWCGTEWQMLRAVEQIDWVRDESMVVDRLKTGELPPPDIKVDLMQARSPFLIVSYFSLSVPGHVWHKVRQGEEIKQPFKENFQVLSEFETKTAGNFCWHCRISFCWN